MTTFALDIRKDNCAKDLGKASSSENVRACQNFRICNFVTKRTVLYCTGQVRMKQERESKNAGNSARTASLELEKIPIRDNFPLPAAREAKRNVTPCNRFESAVDAAILLPKRQYLCQIQHPWSCLCFGDRLRTRLPDREIALRNYAKCAARTTGSL